MSQQKRSAALLPLADFRAQRTNRSHACSRSAADHPASKWCVRTSFSGSGRVLPQRENAMPRGIFFEPGCL